MSAESLMRLSISKEGKTVNELLFEKGPIYIGRQMGSQVFLPERQVSRQHAVIYQAKNQVWMVEDLDSSNKTYLNDQAIHKSQLQQGDEIRISDYNMKVLFDNDGRDPRFSGKIGETVMGETISGDSLLEQSLATASHEVRHDRLVRNVSSKDAPLKITTRRLKDFAEACERICRSMDPTELHGVVIELLLNQLRANEAWAGLRKAADGPMQVQGGRRIDTRRVEQDGLALNDAIPEAIEKHEYLLFPQVWKQEGDPKVRSAVIVPVMAGKKCFGVLYADNSLEHEHYDVSDLDYLIVLSTHIAAVLQYI